MHMHNHQSLPRPHGMSALVPTCLTPLFKPATPGPSLASQTLQAHARNPTTTSAVPPPQAGDRVWAAIGSGAAEADPRLLAPALLLAYCDLKHYKYRYWWAFPALQPPQPIALAAPPASLAAALGGDAAVAAVAAACAAHVAATGLPAWLVSMDSGGGDGSSAALPGVATAPLTDWARVRQEAEAAAGVPGERQVWLAVADSSHLAENPGWLLRNLLLLAAARWVLRGALR